MFHPRQKHDGWHRPQYTRPRRHRLKDFPNLWMPPPTCETYLMLDPKCRKYTQSELQSSRSIGPRRINPVFSGDGQPLPPKKWVTQPSSDWIRRLPHQRIHIKLRHHRSISHRKLCKCHRMEEDGRCAPGRSKGRRWRRRRPRWAPRRRPWTVVEIPGAETWTDHPIPPRQQPSLIPFLSSGRIRAVRTPTGWGAEEMKTLGLSLLSSLFYSRPPQTLSEGEELSKRILTFTPSPKIFP